MKASRRRAKGGRTGGGPFGLAARGGNDPVQPSVSDERVTPPPGGGPLGPAVRGRADPTKDRAGWTGRASLLQARRGPLDGWISWIRGRGSP